MKRLVIKQPLTGNTKRIKALEQSVDKLLLDVDRLERILLKHYDVSRTTRHSVRSPFI